MNRAYQEMIKIMMVGDSNVGKTSIMKCFCEGGPQNLKNIRNTVGLDYGEKVVSIKGKNVLVQIWDTAGQQKFQTLTPSYYRSAMGIFLVFSVTQKSSFNSVQLWMRQIKQYSSEDIPVVILCNKIDIMTRQVSEAQSKGLQKRHGVKTMYTSAVNNHNIMDAITLLYSLIKEQRKIKPTNTNTNSVHLVDIKKQNGEGTQCKC